MFILTRLSTEGFFSLIYIIGFLFLLLLKSTQWYQCLMCTWWMNMRVWPQCCLSLTLHSHVQAPTEQADWMTVHSLKHNWAALLTGTGWPSIWAFPRLMQRSSSEVRNPNLLFQFIKAGHLPLGRLSFGSVLSVNYKRILGCDFTEKWKRTSQESSKFCLWWIIADRNLPCTYCYLFQQWVEQQYRQHQSHYSDNNTYDGSHQKCQDGGEKSSDSSRLGGKWETKCKGKMRCC